METIRSIQWSDEDKEFIGWEKSVAEAWGLDKEVISDLPRKPKVCRVESPSSSSPPAPQVFKVNFDGVAKGNPGMAGFGGACRDHKEEILQVFHGNIGFDSIHLIIRNGSLLAIVEGDS